MNFDNLYFENTEEEEEGVNLPDISKSEAGISPVTGLVRGGGRRGPDIDWREIARYGNRQEYLASQVPESLKDFRLKKGSTTKFAQTEVWLCKFGQKAGYHRCDYRIKLDFLIHSDEVVVLDNRVQHRHEVDSNYALSGKKYQWTAKQEQILLPLIHRPPRRCLRELKKEEALSVQGIFPTLTQINSKKKYLVQKKGEVLVPAPSTDNSSVQLAWSQFDTNSCSRFKEIRTSGDFADVTLVTDDGTREGHRLILASGSSFFERVLCTRTVGHPRPLLYLRGIDTHQLDYLLDFLYSGQVSIPESSISIFLELADHLGVRGLHTGTDPASQKN